MFKPYHACYNIISAILLVLLSSRRWVYAR
nr:MAG TPA: Putative holin [Caudoviricetes sp.]